MGVVNVTMLEMLPEYLANIEDRDQEIKEAFSCALEIIQKQRRYLEVPTRLSHLLTAEVLMHANPITTGETVESLQKKSVENLKCSFLACQHILKAESRLKGVSLDAFQRLRGLIVDRALYISYEKPIWD